MSSSQAPRVPNKGAYWASWTFHKFPPSSIDTTHFTHVYFAFLLPNTTTFELEIDGETDGLLRKFTSTLGNKNPPVKTLVSIGGGGNKELPKIFSRMAADAASRRTFILNSIEVAREYDFDGVDLDWEYPKTPKDMENLGDLLKEWRAAVFKDAQIKSKPELLLAAATRFSAQINYGTYCRYPVASINKNLDWINAMCYDYCGPWDEVPATGAHAALNNTRHGLQSWIDANIQKEKLVMGLPLYGRTWTLQDSSINGIGAPAVGIGPGDDEGIMTYQEIETFNAQNDATVMYDTNTDSIYSYAESSWIGYDDVRSVAEKVKYARDQHLGGYFFWAVPGDNESWDISRRAFETWDRR